GPLAPWPSSWSPWGSCSTSFRVFRLGLHRGVRAKRPLQRRAFGDEVRFAGPGVSALFRLVVLPEHEELVDPGQAGAPGSGRQGRLSLLRRAGVRAHAERDQPPGLARRQRYRAAEAPAARDAEPREAA